MTAFASKLYRIACRLAGGAAIIAVIRYGAGANFVIAGLLIFICHRSFLLMKIKRPLRVSFYQVSSPHAPRLRTATWHQLINLTPQRAEQRRHARSAFMA